MIASVAKMNKSVLALAFVAALSASAASVSRVAADALSDSDKQRVVDLHNQVRFAVSPPASNMASMTWDESIASQAAGYASKCQITHSHTPGLGENLSWGWPMNSMSVDGAIALWEAEKSIFRFEGSDMACGHYTQMVWAASTRVGCARQACANLGGKGPGDLYVCNYAQPGNYLNAQGKIGSPYQAGSPQQQTSAAAAPAPAPQQQSQPAPQQQQQKTPEPTPNPTPAPSSQGAAPAVKDSFRWTGGDSAWSACSASCGAGTQTRSIACVNQNNQGAAWDKCDQNTKPKNSQACNSGDCQAPAPTPAPAAPKQEAPKAEEVTYAWSTGEFSACSAACAGTQTRTVQCKSSKGDVSADGACRQAKPASSLPCNGECPKAEEQAAPEQQEKAAPVAEQPKEDAAAEVESVPACANATVVHGVELLFNSTAALNSTGLLRSSLDTFAPSSLNCSAVFYFLNSSGLFNCSNLLNSSAVNSTGGAADAQYALGDCFDSWYGTEFGFVDVDSEPQTHFGSLNFTKAEFDSDYNLQEHEQGIDSSVLAELKAALPVAAAKSAPTPSKDDAIILAAAVPSVDLSTDARPEQIEAIQRAQKLAAPLSESAASAAQHSALLLSALVVVCAALL